MGLGKTAKVTRYVPAVGISMAIYLAATSRGYVVVGSPADPDSASMSELEAATDWALEWSLRRYATQTDAVLGLRHAGVGISVLDFLPPREGEVAPCDS
jgi:hypothetical protein